MLKYPYLDELQLGDEFEGYYILNDAQARRSTNGKPYLSAVISDCSGEMEAKAWDYPGPISGEDNGSVVLIRATVSEFRGNLQATVSAVRPMTERDRFDKKKLVPVAPLDMEQAMEELWEIVDSISDPDYRAICETILHRHEAAFGNSPLQKASITASCPGC